MYQKVFPFARAVTYFTRRRDDVVVEESFDLVRLDLPQQPLDLQLDLPLAVYTYGDHDGAEEYEAEHAGNNHRQHVPIVLRAQLVLKAALRFVGWNVTTRPLDAHDVVELVFLRKRAKLISGRITSSARRMIFEGPKGKTKKTEKKNVRQLTYWKCIIVAVALLEGGDGNHMPIAGEVRVLRGEERFLQRQHGEVAFGVAVLVDADVGAGDALEGFETLIKIGGKVFFSFLLR